jgi:hypothetical protein
MRLLASSKHQSLLITTVPLPTVQVDWVPGFGTKKGPRTEKTFACLIESVKCLRVVSIQETHEPQGPQN